ncbi:MAG: cbb3-type cytochrome c oxidase subunit I [Planctomycetes bacterium]|nr:cbb3-type cytochrome c oxidase subunit I [Planctomycetota bacterium]
MQAATDVMTAEHSFPRQEQLVEERLVLWYFVAALTFMTVSMLAGILMGLQLLRHNPLPPIEVLSPGRWRMIHTNAIAYGFLANAFLGIMHWVVPRLTLRPVFSRPLSYLIFFAWQFVVLATAVGLMFGQAQGLEWGETPVWIDPVAQLGLLLVAINFGTPILQTRGPMYVTLWYYLAALVWTFLTYAMGNFVPEYFVCGSSAGAVGGLFIHDLVGLFVTPLGWGMMYYFVPILLKRPIWSHGLSLVGFWGLAFFYPLQGIHHFLYTPIPMFLQYGAVLSTIALELVVVTVIINFIGTLYGTGGACLTNLPLRYFYTGILFYFLTCLQCALQVTMTFQALIHFTDWVVGHAHMVMFGVFSLWQLGVMTYLIPRILKTEWYNPAWCEWHYWASAGGLLVMAGDLILGGLFQGWSWAALHPWETSIHLSIPFWSVRIVAGLVMFAAQLLFIVHFYLTWRKSLQTAPAVVPAAGLATA